VIRKPVPKLTTTALPSRAELAAALAAAGILATAGDVLADTPAPPAASNTAIEVEVAPAPNEGVLQVVRLKEGVVMFLGEEKIPREELERGVRLPPGRHHLRFHWPCNEDTFHDVDIEAGKTNTLDAVTVLFDPEMRPLGGAPPPDNFRVRGGCCGGHDASAQYPGSRVAALAIAAAALTVARRRKDRPAK
jgi:hypothetical protein